MSEKKDAAEVQPAQSTKLKRGVSNATKAVTQLRFHEKDAATNGLFIGHLEDVTVEWSTSENNKSFTSVSVPRLQFHFASNHSNPNERRHVYQTLFPVESSVDTIPGGVSAWRVDNILNWIKHVLDVFYLKGRQMNEKEEEALSLSFVDYDEKGEYVSVDVEDVVKGYATLFNNAAAILNGTINLKDDGEADGKPCYKNAEGKPINIWMKLLRHRRRKNGWYNVGQNGELAFDQFLGAGAIEIQKPNTPPAILFIDATKESITPKETNKQPNIGGVGAGMMAGLGGVMTPMGQPMTNDAFNVTDGEMPF